MSWRDLGMADFRQKSLKIETIIAIGVKNKLRDTNLSRNVKLTESKTKIHRILKNFEIQNVILLSPRGLLRRARDREAGPAAAPRVLFFASTGELAAQLV